MVEEERLIAEAFQQAFKRTTYVPSDLYIKMNHELKIDDNEPLKVNLTMKRGLVLDIEDDSLFRTFLTVGDIVLTINDRVASRPEFKLHEAFGVKKTITFSYIRLRNYSPEDPIFEEGDRRDNFDYKVAVIYCLQRMTLGLAMEGLNNRVYITKIAPKSLGSRCAAVGDVILQVNGKRVCDTDKAMALIADELESKSHFKITLERAKTEEARAQVQFAITKENRDPPIPADCAEYIEKAMLALRSADPKSIMRTRFMASEEGSRVGFHDRITTENVIPSDIADEALIKTPARVPNQPAQQQQPPPSTTGSGESIDRGEQTVTKDPLMNNAEMKKPPPKEVKTTNRRSKGSSKKLADSASVGGGSTGRSKESGRKKLSAEILFGRSKKKSGGTAEAAKKQKKKNKREQNSISADTEGPQ